MILVDDGIATGASMIAAVRSVRQSGAAQIVVGVPVGPASVCRRLRDEADDVVCSTMPARFRAVGEVFEDFHQISDEEVRDLLATPDRRARTRRRKPLSRGGSALRSVVGCRLPAQVLFKG